MEMFLTRALTFMLLLGTVSCMIFRSQRYVPANCPSGFPHSTLQYIAQGMSNSSMTNIFQRLLPSILVERVSGSQGNLNVRQFIKQEMNNLGWTVEEDTFNDNTPLGPVTFSNIIATFNPNKAKRIVVACHYDSKLMNGNIPFLAATDSAVPCAVMLDSARRLNQMLINARNSNIHDFTFQFIFFDGEEAVVDWTSTDSLYGSRHLANKWERTLDKNDPSAVNNLQNIALFILLDLIGTHDTQFFNHFSNTANQFSDLLSIESCLGRAGLLTTPRPRLLFQPRGPRYQVSDDHEPFLQRNVPILHLISTPFPSVWHTTNDDLRHLDGTTVDNFSRIFRLYMASLLV